jgi:hypothetical protein
VIWDRSGNDPDSHFGAPLYPLGDQNDDGFADWIVWCQAGDVGTESESKAQFFHGGNPPTIEPYLTILAPRDALELSAASSNGDVNGDGFVDWHTAVRYPGSNLVHISMYWGGPDYDEIPDLQFALGGYSIRNAGYAFDFNGDSYDDIYI